MTATIIESDTDLDTVLDETVDSDKTCELAFNKESCDNKAEYEIIKKCCDITGVPSCEDCMFQLIEGLKNFRMKCDVCGNISVGFSDTFGVVRL